MAEPRWFSGDELNPLRLHSTANKRIAQSDTGGLYFWDESDTAACGPYADLGACLRGIEAYVKHLDGRRSTEQGLDELAVMTQDMGGYPELERKTPRAPRRYGPLDPDHPAIGQLCEGCREQLKAGDYLALIVIGPGGDVNAREAAMSGRAYNAVTIAVHWACATGEAAP